MIDVIDVIIPTLNESHRLPVAVAALRRALGPQLARIIIADNGSSDNTATRAAALGCDVIRLPNPAKGAAVAAGMILATAPWRYMADVDLAAPPATAIEMVRLARASGADVVLGVRPFWRGSLLRTAASAAYRLATAGVASDPQCGFKLFGAAAATYVFKRLQTDGLAFDAEAIALARYGGFQVIETHVEWHHDPDSRVNVWRDSARMARDLIRLRRSLSQAPR